MSDLYPWLMPVWQHWQANLQSNQWPSALLLTVDDGMGGELLVEQLSASLMCEHFEQQACGFCHSCELMKLGNHPDVHKIAAEKEGKSISIDQIRATNRIAQSSSQLGRYRLIIIEAAHRMTESAANALLKTLESSSSECLFLLITSKYNKLLPTVISRCQQWHIASPDPQITQDWIEKELAKTSKTDVSHKVPRYLIALNHFAPLQTLTFIKNGDDKAYFALETAFVQFFSTPIADIDTVWSTIQADPSVHLTWLWLLLNDSIKVHFGLQQQHLLPASYNLSQKISYSLLYKYSQLLRSLITQLSDHAGLNAELLTLNWLMNFHEEVCL